MTERMCRACGLSLISVLDLGNLALSGFPIGDEAPDFSPLDLCRCSACGLVQLRHTVEPDVLFKQYWYKSGVNETMRAELQDVMYDALVQLGYLLAGDVIVDVGANDGTLLAWAPRGVTRIAYEPAENLQDGLRKHCDVLYPEYFPGKQPLEPGSVSLLTSIACFYAVDDPIKFVSAVNEALSARGIWVLQFQDLHQMLMATAFDDICHEHLFYPSLASIMRMLEPFDLEVIDAERREINGGSLRVTVGRRWRHVSPNVKAMTIAEYRCEHFMTLRDFAQRVMKTREKIYQALDTHRGPIDLYGASTKGNTLLQVCDLGPKDIRQAWERSPEKWGRKTVTGIPIVSEESGRANPPAMLFVGIWQFRDAIIRREAAYLAQGGKLLFPLQRVEVIDVHKGVGAHSHSASA